MAARRTTFPGRGSAGPAGSGTSLPCASRSLEFRGLSPLPAPQPSRRALAAHSRERGFPRGAQGVPCKGGADAAPSPALGDSERSGVSAWALSRRQRGWCFIVLGSPRCAETSGGNCSQV